MMWQEGQRGFDLDRSAFYRADNGDSGSGKNIPELIEFMSKVGEPRGHSALWWQNDRVKRLMADTSGGEEIDDAIVRGDQKTVDTTKSQLPSSPIICRKSLF
jgi:hypothetical protein